MTPYTVVLIVDDEPSILMLLSEILTDEGFKVVQAENGQAALDIALTSSPDLIITDLMMPIMNGHLLAQHVRAHTRMTMIPIILISAAYRKQGDDLFTAVINKPFEIDTLVETVRAFIE